MVDESQRQLKDCGVSSRSRHDKFSGKLFAELCDRNLLPIQSIFLSLDCGVSSTCHKRRKLPHKILFICYRRLKFMPWFLFVFVILANFT